MAAPQKRLPKPAPHRQPRLGAEDDAHREGDALRRDWVGPALRFTQVRDEAQTPGRAAPTERVLGEVSEPMS